MTVKAFAAMRAKDPLIPFEYPTPSLGKRQVEIKVSFCALCHSDLHLIDGDWSSAQFPLVPGHEIIGEVVACGDDVKTLHIGAMVGVGWQCGSCGLCEQCTTGQEHLCGQAKERTCVGRFGGFARRVFINERFVYRLPPELVSAAAAPLLCAGVTVYSPLKRFLAESSADSSHELKKKRLGVIGMGGLGHLAIQFGAALGMRVTVFDPHSEKKASALALGAEALISSEKIESGAAGQDLCGSFDMIISTTHADLNWNCWLDLLALNGQLCLTGVPPSEKICIHPDHLLDGQKKITGSVIGSPSTMREMLSFAAQHRIFATVEIFPAGEINSAINRLRQGQVRHRAVIDFRE